MRDETIKNVDCYLFFELETVALKGREVFFKVYQEVLKKKDVELTFDLYIKHGLKSLPGFAIPAMMAAVGKGSAGTKQIEDEALKKIIAELNGLSIDPAFTALVNAAQERGIRVMALSALPEEHAQALLTSTGLAESGVELYVDEEPHEEFPRTDIWLSMIRSMELEPRACLTLASSSRACKGALTADMVGIAVPDAYTSFQDFSGAHYVLDDLAEVQPAELIDSTLVASI
jgi:beta-phosphoglucomutase-like phosphatase (HAD superfamily)